MYTLKIDELEVSTKSNLEELEKKFEAFIYASKLFGYTSKYFEAEYVEAEMEYMKVTIPGFKRLTLTNREKHFNIIFNLSSNNHLNYIEVFARYINKGSNIVKSRLNEREMLKVLDELIEFL